MSVLAVYEQIEESGERSADGYSFARNFVVSVDGPTEVLTVLEAARIPRKGDLHPSGKSSCVSVNATNDGDLWWDVVATYEPTETTTGGGAGNEDTNTTPTITISGRGRQVARLHDASGRALVNSAGDAFEPDVFDDAGTVITIRSNIPFDSFTLTLADEWRGVVHAGPMIARIVQDPAPDNVTANVPAFFGYGTGVVRCTDIGADIDNSGDQSRWNLNLQFEVADSWIGSALDMGMHRTSAAAIGRGVQGSQGLQQINIVDRTPILDKNGVPVVTPVLLDGAGKPLAANSPAWFVVWDRYRHKNLNQLLQAFQLPTTLAGYKVVLA